LYYSNLVFEPCRCFQMSERTGQKFFLNELNLSNSSFLLKWTGSTIYFNSYFIENEYFEKFSSLTRTVRSGQFVGNTVSNSSSVLNETWTWEGLLLSLICFHSISIYYSYLSQTNRFSVLKKWNNDQTFVNALLDIFIRLLYIH